MSDADWWLCECQSLNNLSARRCYSCRRPRPKSPVRASEHLGYRVVVSWDGKVRHEQRRPDVVVPVAPWRPPPLREPVRRSIADLAPPPPTGARITYWLGDPALDPRRPAPVQPPPVQPVPVQPVPVQPVPVQPLPPAWFAPPAPVGETPAPRPVVGVPVDGSQPPLPPLPLPPPAVAVPIVGGPPIDLAEDPPPPDWPHWRELLDGPRPDAARLRRGPDDARLRRGPEASSQHLRTRLEGPDVLAWRRTPAGSTSEEPSEAVASRPAVARRSDFWPPEPGTGREPAPSPAEPVPWPAADMAARRPDPSAT